MNKIQRLSRLLHLFFKSLCWLIPAVMAYLIFFNMEAMIHYGMFDKILSASRIQATDYSMLQRAILFLIQAIPLSITVFICHKLARLFRLYEQGCLFEVENIRIIRQISLFMITGELIHLVLYQPLITAALSFNNPPGQRFISITFGEANASTLMTAIIILLASWIVKEAYQLKADAQLTI
ncbi:DUF2975 domain-containing protein [Legionella spiritensis]|uniref:DUF2975 domain-containing protein n=1 Tax=Legionella spiritensis TaxID=452 RepID=A0A0W0ZAZ0_LEGSP|nr:DUF2975 domain-containing protein [Legionella spiritensis]KTD66322.1 hypothetical protein Lspi_0085 [Legionella spiritensis]SNV48637.1 Protein of uncharacterised function (DUF2975) [Legionella spiritensis]